MEPHEGLRYSEHFLVFLCVALNTGVLFGVRDILAVCLGTKIDRCDTCPAGVRASTSCPSHEDAITAASFDIQNSCRAIIARQRLFADQSPTSDSLGQVQPSRGSDVLRPLSWNYRVSLALPFAAPEVAALKYTGRKQRDGLRASGGTFTTWSVEFTDTNVTYFASPTIQPIAGYPDGPYVRAHSVSRAVLDSLIALRILYEAKYWLPRHLLRIASEARSSLTSPSAVYLFIYQEAMALPGANPNYFTPTSAGGRAAFFTYTLARYLFTALFIGTIVREWWSDKARRAPP